jgi:nuclear transport factor 2 (NTF2) superfamily protein
MTNAEANQLLREAEVAFGTADVERILAMFTEDVVVRFADLPEMRGRAAYSTFLKSRFERQRNYRPRKTLRAVTGDSIVDSWDGTWEDALTGRRMCGRGIEILVIRRGKVAQLDAVFNTWQEAVE